MIESSGFIVWSDVWNPGREPYWSVKLWNWIHETGIGETNGFLPYSIEDRGMEKREANWKGPVPEPQTQRKEVIRRAGCPRRTIVPLQVVREFPMQIRSQRENSHRQKKSCIGLSLKDETYFTYISLHADRIFYFSVNHI